MATESKPQDSKLTLESILTGGSLNISPVAWQQIDPNLWFTSTSKDSTATHITTWVARHMQNYTYGDLTGDDLFYAFQEDFASWTESDFDSIVQPFKRELKLLHRKRRIYTGRNNGPIGRQLLNLLKLDTCPEWPDDEPCLYPDDRTEKVRIRVPYENDIQDQLRTTAFSAPGIAQSREITEQQPLKPYPYRSQRQLQPQVPAATSSSSYNPYNTLPPLPTPNEDFEANVLTQFAKLWSGRKMYSGEPYDILDDKL